MKSSHSGRLLACSLAVFAGLLGAEAQAEGFKADCTDPAVNEHFRSHMDQARTADGNALESGVRLELVGDMRAIDKEGPRLTCQATVKVTVQDGRFALRSTTVYLTVQDGVLDDIDFVMAPNR